MQKKDETGNMGAIATAMSRYTPGALAAENRVARWHEAYLQAARDLMDRSAPGTAEEVIAYATKIADGAIAGPK